MSGRASGLRRTGGAAGFVLVVALWGGTVQAGELPRARELGVPFDGVPGPANAITDVAGVLVGHTTLISGEGDLEVGKGPVRTGVTAVLPRGRSYDPVFAGWFALNGNGEMTGTAWIDESGFLEGPIVVTNTHSVGVARDAVVEWQHRKGLFNPLPGEPDVFWALPVVAETYDGELNDINGFHVRKEHVFAALDGATGGAVAEGGVGGGTGMVCHEFKGGIGTASRLVELEGRACTVGVLVQANYGIRETLTIAGVPVGRILTDRLPELRSGAPGSEAGSIIVVVATDAPLLPVQLRRLARRVPVGIARVGGFAANSSGDIFVAFSTANPGAAARTGIREVRMLPNDALSPLFRAVAEATEESIVNALIAGQDMVGIWGNRVYGIPHGPLVEALREHGRLVERHGAR